jgi:uncharacterized protein YkwD
MRRCAQFGLVAMLLCGALVFFVSPQSTPTAAAGGSNRVFIPAVISASSPYSAAEIRAVELINQQRRANGCATVSLNSALSKAADAHSTEMSAKGTLSHTGSDGSTFGQRATAAGYDAFASGEVLAGGQPTADDVVRAWMNSSGHRKIILTCANDDIGIALVENPQAQYRYYWTAVFGQR